MSFHDVRLPDDIERGASGGPRFSTSIIEVDSGAERRNVNWSLPLAQWDVGFGVRTQEQYAELRSFFMLRRGRAYSFRFKDWSDYQVERMPGPGLYHDSVPMTFTDTVRALPLLKRYRDDSGLEFQRPITHPVLATMVLHDNRGRIIPASDWTWDAERYEIHMITGNYTHTTMACEFDIPVRFDTDQFNITLDHVNAGEVPALPVTELRPASLVATG